MVDKPRSQQNQDFLDSQYLDGANASYLEQMQARYAADPSSVDASWRAYFDTLAEPSENARKVAAGPSWRRADWPQDYNGELTSALTGDWGPDEAEITQKSRRVAREWRLTM